MGTFVPEAPAESIQHARNCPMCVGGSASPPTLAEVREWPATVDVSAAAKAIGISKSHLYALITKGEAPVRVLPFGGRQRVVTASLIHLLECA